MARPVFKHFVVVAVFKAGDTAQRRSVPSLERALGHTLSASKAGGGDTEGKRQE